MRKDALENRQRIESHAAKLFKTEGVEQVSMKRISEELNIGMGTLYRHFEDKSALCYQLINNDFESFMTEIETIAQQPTDAKEMFIQSIDQFLQFKMKHKDLLHCVEMGKSKRDFRQTSFFERLHGYYCHILNMNNGNSQTDLTFKVDVLMNTLTTQHYQFLTEQRALSNLQIREQLVSLFFNDN
ncbi:MULTISPECIES: TetR/AcrR family transcriptional regulator [Staphylococcus]|uniref:TetR/AcrR family transcriptional regulator n=1 Tax=Staphylococcus TaxID=1279 RepID=UPI000597CF5B|nr:MULTISPECIES: TetR/AcrR family transcriptional regulator [Staphylococcus]KIJ86537.1 hypothetical protein SE00_08250 [Staphylococcus saprophyticus]MBF2752258.1 TetR/AcrR family transcriptional regulator [Staphylococcus saprophyticus]MBN6095616.1 TetR/AcrR family transcriptional regulator [Staphylococcus saprophyticus]MBN6096063.1 TetR/AcrR family transcriptional regulator [Staphylococcus saprophyticus]MBN6099086.1 TetR/AcrR family transcriptional regulator [Staphylococcus saprophyticus]